MARNLAQILFVCFAVHENSLKKMPHIITPDDDINEKYTKAFDFLL